MRFVLAVIVPCALFAACLAERAGAEPLQLAKAEAEMPLISPPPITAIPSVGRAAVPALRASSANAVKVPHFHVWAGYDLDIALHPYTSGIGPCPEGGGGPGCGPSHGTVIKPSVYELPPYTD